MSGIEEIDFCCFQKKLQRWFGLQGNRYKLFRKDEAENANIGVISEWCILVNIGVVAEK